MKKIYAFAIVFPLYVACGQNVQKKEAIEDVKIYYPDGHLKTFGHTLNGKKTGTSKTYFENGAQKTENHWENDIQVGKTQKWFPNGKINWVGQIINGKEGGEWKYYDDLTGDYIYSVFYKNGEVDHFEFSKTKYHWRTIQFSKGNFELNLPSYISDSTVLENGITAYWSMFPWSQKREIEYYYISIYPSVAKDINLLQAIEKLKDTDLLKSIAQSNDASDLDALIPDIAVDKVSLISKKLLTINGVECLEIIANFNDLNLNLCSLLFISNGKLCVIGAYRNEKMDDAIIDKFFNSLKKIN